MKYFKNSSWMLAEHFLRVVAAIFVSIYVARYLGPEQFGVLSYALAIVAIFMAICRMGMDSILVRDLIKFPEKSLLYMGTAFYLMLFIAVLGFFALGFLVLIIENNFQTKIYILIIASSLLFQTFLVVAYNFQAQVKAKYSAMAKSFALAISSSIKIYLVWEAAGLLAFAVAYAFDAFVIAVMLFSIHVIQKEKNFLFVFDKNLVFPLVKSAWPMALAAAAFVLYGKADQLMIKTMLGTESLGLYAAAMKIFEGWAMVPFVILISLFPMIVKSKQKSTLVYEQKLIQILTWILWATITVALIATLFNDWIIKLTFGEQYAESAKVLPILMWAAVFTALGTFSARYLAVEKMEKKVIKVTLGALIINVILNYLFIPIWGIEGAAFATLCSLFFGYYVVDFFDQDLSQLRRIKQNSIFFILKGVK